MIKVDESDPVGELEPSFPYKDITIRKGVDMKEHYELQSEIGRGKFGTVFKCREKATGLMLAAKFVGIVHKQDRRNAEREVEIMCELQHPRLIQLYDAFEANNAMCFVLELVEGGELFERVIGDDFVLTEKAVTIFMRQICEGVQFIHSKNILHLDLKPENILCLTKTGNRVKIIDFGLARKFNPDNKLQVLFGTPEFVAPEVVNFDAIGFGTDMWSVGVICYVLLSGLSPFMGETDVETMANVTVAQYDFDDEAFDSISNDAKDFIKKLLVKDHKSRPSATECLSHRWMQKRKPKRTAQRKNSGKCSVKNTGEKTGPPTSAKVREDVAVLPLDASKENLRELCGRSRSQSPAGTGTAAQTPSLAQLRIQRDGRLSKGDCSPRPSASGAPRTVLDEPRTPDPCSEPSLGTETSAGGPNPSVRAVEKAAVAAAAPNTRATDEDDPLPGRFPRPEGTAAPPQSVASGSADEPQPRTDGPKAVAGEPRPTESAGADVPRSRATPTAANSGGYRRSSDVSYTFSSFRSCTTTVQTSSSSSSSSSGLLQQQQRGTSDLRGLSERLLRLGGRGCGENLHAALLQLQTVDRRPKFKFTSRDVPVGSAPPASNLMYYVTAAATSVCRSAPHSERASPEHESISAKEMLLKLFYGDANVEPKLQST